MILDIKIFPEQQIFNALKKAVVIIDKLLNKELIADSELQYCKEVMRLYDINNFFDVYGYEGLYKISKDGIIINQQRGNILKPKIQYDGYLQVCLHNKTNKKFRLIHRLVGETFIPNPLNYPQINHKDGNKQNNCVGNLEWVTASQNILHSFQTGLNIGKEGNANPATKITDREVEELRLLRKSGMSQKDLAVKYHVSISCICNIVNNKKRI